MTKINSTAKHVRLYTTMMDAPAWKGLTPTDRCVWLELQRKFNGKNNGQIVMSSRTAAELVGVAKDTAARSLRKLQDHGFTEQTKAASFRIKIWHSPEWRLTDQPYNGHKATDEWKHWQPRSDQKDMAKSGSRSDERDKSVRPEGHTRSDERDIASPILG